METYTKAVSYRSIQVNFPQPDKRSYKLCTAEIRFFSGKHVTFEYRLITRQKLFQLKICECSHRMQQQQEAGKMNVSSGKKHFRTPNRQNLYSEAHFGYSFPYTFPH